MLQTVIVRVQMFAGRQVAQRMKPRLFTVIDMKFKMNQKYSCDLNNTNNTYTVLGINNLGVTFKFSNKHGYNMIIGPFSEERFLSHFHEIKSCAKVV